MEGFGGLGKIRGMLRFDVFLAFYAFFCSVAFHFCLSNATTMSDCHFHGSYHTFSIMLLLKFLYLVCIVIRFQVFTETNKGNS